jgi:hypothetical protein
MREYQRLQKRKVKEQRRAERKAEREQGEGAKQGIGALTPVSPSEGYYLWQMMAILRFH